MIKTQNSILEHFAKDLYLERVFPALREKKTQQFITFALTLFGITFFILFAVNPTVTTIIDLQKQLADNQFADRQLQEKISNLSTLEQKYNSMQNDLPAIFAAVPQQPQINVLLGQLYALAVNNHLTVTRLQTTNTQIAPLIIKPTTDQTFDFAISVSGDKNAVMNFLHAVAHFERVITIDSLTYSVSNRDTSQTNVLILDMKGKGHFALAQSQ